MSEFDKQTIRVKRDPDVQNAVDKCCNEIFGNYSLRVQDEILYAIIDEAKRLRDLRIKELIETMKTVENDLETAKESLSHLNTLT